jgi:hypothetical protein
MCEKYCSQVDPCLELSRKEREAGFDKIKGPYVSIRYGIDHKGRFCSTCEKAIARPETADHSFKGMLMIHLKNRHYLTWLKHKNGEIPFEELWHTKDLVS